MYRGTEASANYERNQQGLSVKDRMNTTTLSVPTFDISQVPDWRTCARPASAPSVAPAPPPTNPPMSRSICADSTSSSGAQTMAKAPPGRRAVIACSWRLHTRRWRTGQQQDRRHHHHQHEQHEKHEKHEQEPQ